MYFTYPSGTTPTAGQLGSLAASVAANWNTGFVPLVHPNMSLSQVIADDLGSEAGAQGIANVGYVGARTGGELPINCCAVVNHKINRSYRGGKPRNYIVVGTDTDTTNGRQWVSAFPATVLNAWNNMVAAGVAGIAGVNLTYVSAQYFKGAQPNDNTGTWQPANEPKPLVPPQVWPIVSSSVSLMIGSQRRRLRAGG